MLIDFITVESNEKEQFKRYWFLVDGEEYALNVEPNGSSLLDSEGYPVANEGHSTSHKYNEIFEKLSTTVNGYTPAD